MRGLIVGTLLALGACGGSDGPEAPEIAGASLVTDEDTPIEHTVEASDPRGGALALAAESPLHGAIAVDGLRVTYTPAADYHGADSFLVTVSGRAGEASVRIDVIVRPVNDAPLAAADSFAALEDTPLVRSFAALLANDRDVDGDTLSVMAVHGATHGAVSSVGTDVTFTPAANYSGVASFQYTVGDGAVTATATVAITVGGVNDAPAAAADTAATQEDTPVDVPVAALLGNDTDPDDQSLIVTGVGNATHGAVVLAGGMATFTPAADYSGAATFEYTVSDGAATATGVVTVDVGAVNDAPVAADDTTATAEDTPLQLTSSALVANDADVDGPALAVTQVGNAINGTVVLAGGVATFTPAANFSGTGSFEYTVSDGAATDTGTVAIDVTPVNDPPVAAADTAATPEDTLLVVAAASLIANDTDVDGPGLAVTQVGNAANGSVALAGGNVTFTPAANFHGTGSFEYTVSDGAAIATGVVTVDVTSVNDPPIAGDDARAVQAGTALVLPHASLLGNDTDVDGPALAITAVQGAVNGVAVLDATTVTFMPEAGYTGPASFEYVVSDGTDSDVATVAITVTPGPICGDGAIIAPEACDDGNTVAGDGCGAACAIELGWDCIGAPSDCSEICGDGMTVGAEVCDDGNAVDTDGCTSQCVAGAVCTAAALPGGDRFAVDPATGHCYAAFDGEQTTFAAAQAACAAAGGYLVTIASAGEQALAHSVQNPAENPWIGAGEDAGDTDAIFDWVTDEPFNFASFAPGQPDDDAGAGDNGDCLHLADAAGLWADTSCDLATFVVGRICEREPDPCGDSVRQPALGEECDDGNATGGDGCSATCQKEDGCGDGNLDGSEQCDDDNLDDGDGCSATCQRERLAIFTFTGANGDEVTFPADGTAPAPGLASIPVIRRGPGLARAAAPNEFSAELWQVNPAIDLTDYYSFTVTPAAGFSASLLGIELDERRSPSGPLFWAVRSSLDGFTANIAMFALPDDSVFRRDELVPLGPQFSNLTAPVEFRIYGWDAEASLGTWRLDNVEIFGFTTGP